MITPSQAGGPPRLTLEGRAPSVPNGGATAPTSGWNGGPSRAAVTASLVAVLVLSGCGGGPASTVAGRADWATAPAGATVVLPARVTFDAMQLGIENGDTRSWREVVVEVRRPGDARIYRYRADVIVGGRTLLMGALNFATDDGARLSPFSGAPTEWRIQAVLPDGVRGWASGAIVEVAPR